MKWLKRGWILLLVAGFSAAMFLPYCHTLFRCGCQGFWAAGYRLCNIHTRGVAHCPWCSTGWWGALVPIALIWTAQAGVVLAPRGPSSIRRFILGISVFAVVGAAVGLVFGLWTHYPVFIWK